MIRRLLDWWRGPEIEAECTPISVSVARLHQGVALRIDVKDGDSIILLLPRTSAVELSDALTDACLRQDAEIPQ